MWALSAPERLTLTAYGETETRTPIGDGISMLWPESILRPMFIANLAQPTKNGS